ncbi:MAG: hypothetical protein EBR82_65495, partial [Caulobacteraceae bacterium]|nr:hypothetical protein [Caulobacteraceae bacterium]
MADEVTPVPAITHPGVKAASTAGVVAFILGLWQVIGPLLPPSTQTAIQPWVKVATDNQDKILQIEQWIADQQKKPVDPTPVIKPDPTIEALKEQIRLQNEAIQKLLHPNPPVVVTPVLPSAIKATDSQGKPITGDVPEGRQFRITGDVGTWTILPATSPDIDV